MRALDFVTDLEQAAARAQVEEMSFRRDVATGIAVRERERQFAFRRVDLARTMARAASGAEDRETAVAAQLAALRREFGWHGESDERRRIFAAWSAVADAVWQELQPRSADDAAGPDAQPASLPDASVNHVRDAMLVFERWYEGEFSQPFLALLDHEIPEMPVVEF